MYKTLISSLAKRASRAPHDIVLVGAEEALTANTLYTEILLCAEQLHTAGITSLALHADNSPTWIIVDLACQYAKICLVPLPLSFSARQKEHVLKSSGVDAVISQEKMVVDGNTVEISCLNVANLTCQQLAAHSATLPAGTDKITFTSGSTGKAKGVCLSSQQQLCVAQGIVERLQLSKPRHLSLLPLSTLLENIAGVYAPLLANGRIHTVSLQHLGMLSRPTLREDKLLAQLSDCQPNSLILVPELLQVLIQACENGWQPPQSLLFVAVGGGKVSPALLESARQHGLPVYEGYGLSECSSVVCLNSPEQNRTGSVGKPLSFTDVSINNGEVHILGKVFLGYVNDPASWEQHELATGDLGYIDDDGYVFIEGRLGNRLISSFGRNISPEWIESELLAGPLLAQAIVVGDAKPYCAALVHPCKPETKLAEIDQWVASVNQQLPDYAQIQRWQCLDQPLTRDKQLLTSNGRPRRQAIQQQLADEISALYEGYEEVHH